MVKVLSLVAAVVLTFGGSTSVSATSTVEADTSWHISGAMGILN